jgi:hypothetical protein
MGGQPMTIHFHIPKDKQLIALNEGAETSTSANHDINRKFTIILIYSAV